MVARYQSVPVEGTPPLQMVTLDAAAPGPCVVVSGNLHGDELTGLVACRRLVERLDGALRSGRVVLLPSLNPAGLAEGGRGVPPDGADLNRSFPGRRRGGPAERLAASIWKLVVDLGPSLALDLHADSSASIPYVLVDRALQLGGPERRAVESDLRRFAAATGLTVVREYPDDQFLRYALDRSLTGALVNRAGIPALTIEAGPRRAVDAAAVAAAVGAVVGALAELGMVDGAEPAHPTRVEGAWRRTASPRATGAGWWDPSLAPGARFAEGEPLGSLRRPDGQALEVVRADRSGLVLSWVESPWASVGAALGTIAEPEVAG
jgi:predicted deacylase